MLPARKLPPAFNRISKLVGNIKTGLSTSYGAHSVARAVKQVAVGGSSLMRSLHHGEHDATVDTMLNVLKHADPKIEHKLRTTGLTEQQQKNLLHQVRTKLPLGATQKKAAKALLSALGSKTQAAAATKAQTVRDWAAERQQEEHLTAPAVKSATSVYEGKSSTTYQMRGDQVVRGTAGQTGSGALSSARDLLSPRKGTPSVIGARRPLGAPPAPAKPISRGFNTNFRPIA